jgi:hypothetical protein
VRLRAPVLIVLILGFSASATLAIAGEPNDGITQADGPVTGGTANTGAIETSNDEDWYVFYVAGRRQLDIATTQTSCSNPDPDCYGGIGAELRDGDGDSIDSTGNIYVNTTRHIRRSVSTGRYFVVVSGDQGPRYSMTVNGSLASKECFEARRDQGHFSRRASRLRKKLRRRGSAKLRRAYQQARRQLAAAKQRAASAC